MEVMKYLLPLIILFYSGYSLAYKLTVIQGLSKTKNTFVTRTGKKDGVFNGKKVTFTADDVSIIATAISVTREFTQWQIDNDFTSVPFKRGDIITYYDATEHLWALTPEKLKKKYIKSQIFEPYISIIANVSLMRGLNASVSEASAGGTQRGAVSYEFQVEKQMSETIAIAGGMRYANEIVNVSEASIKSTRLLAIFETKYYFENIPKLYNARFSLGLGLGYGQSVTSSDSVTSSGFASVLPITKIALNIPMSNVSDFITDISFENMRIEEELEDGNKQTSNNSNLKFGFGYKHMF